MTSSAVPSHLSRLSERFVQFAIQECRAYTPLYERRALGIAADKEPLARCGGHGQWLEWVNEGA